MDLEEESPCNEEEWNVLQIVLVAPSHALYRVANTNTLASAVLRIGKRASLESNKQSNKSYGEQTQDTLTASQQ